MTYSIKRVSNVAFINTRHLKKKTNKKQKLNAELAMEDCPSVMLMCLKVPTYLHPAAAPDA